MTIQRGTEIGPYRVVEPVATGGMGEIYAARDTRLDREVAIKILPADMARDAAALTRFQRESRAVAALTHPNIVTLYDVGTHEGMPYAVTELLLGETLRARLDRTGTLAWTEAADVGLAIAKGLGYAHEKGIVHRDVKPANIFLTEDGQVKLLDFGVARLDMPFDRQSTGAPSTKTASGHLLGTLVYMAPEQLDGERTDGRSDFFSLGCVLFEMLMGRHPFAANNLVNSLMAMMKEAPPPIEGAGGCPRELETLVERCLEKSPEARFQKADEIVIHLAQLVGSTVSSSFAVLPAELRRARRRHYGWRMAAAAAALVTLLGFGAWVVQRGGLDAAPLDHRAALAAVAQSPRSALAIVPATDDPNDERSADMTIALAELLRRNLELDGDLRVVDAGELRLETPTPDVPRSLILARWRRAVGVDLAGLLRVEAEEGDAWTASFDLFDTGEGSTLAAVSGSASTAELPALVTKLVRASRASLGLASLSATPRSGAALPADGDALGAFGEGLRAARNGRPGAAKRALGVVIDADPGFLPAYRSLAAAQLALGEIEQAAATLRRARRLADDLPPAHQQRLEADADRIEGDWPRAAERYGRLWRQVDDVELGLALAEAQWQSGQHAEAARTLDVLRALPKPFGDDLRIALAAVALDGARGDRHAQAASARELVAVARDLELPRVLGRLHVTEAASWVDIGQPAAAEQALTQAIEAFAGAEDLAGEVRARLQLATLAARTGDRLLQADHLAAVESLLAGRGRPDLEAWLDVSRAAWRRARGEVDAAVAAATRAYDTAEQLGAPGLAAHAAVELGWARLRAGTLQAADDGFAAARRHSQVASDRAAEAASLVGRGWVRLLAAEPTAAEEALGAASSLVATAGVGPVVAQIDLARGTAALMRGRLDAATTHLASASEIAGSLALPALDADIALARAALATARREIGQAAALARVAAEAYQRQGRVGSTALARLFAGRALASGGEGKAARVELRTARDELGAGGGLLIRLALGLTDGRLDAESSLDRVLGRLEVLRGEADAAGLTMLELEARLAQADVVQRHGDRRSAFTRLGRVRNDAASRGLGWTADRAEAMAAELEMPGGEMRDGGDSPAGTNAVP